MSRFHTLAAVLIGTGLASASAFSMPDSKGQHGQVPQQTADQKSADTMLMLSPVFTGTPGSTNPAAVTPGQSSTVFTPGMSSLGTCPCVGSPPEGEANCGLPIDSVNGGCNYTPQLYSNIAFPGSVCGTVSWDGTTRDLDWYKFTLTATTNVSWTVRAEFAPCNVWITDGLCPPNVLGFSQGFTACADVVATAPSLTAGIYGLIVAPDFGAPIIACGVDNQYKGTLGVFSCSAPANNGCAAAVAISGNGPFLGTNACATLDGVSNCGTFSKDVWYTWTANTTGNVSFKLCNAGTNYDTEIAIYDGSGCVGALLGCNDDALPACASNAVASEVTVPVVNGNPYKVQVGGWAGSEGNFELTVGAPPPPPNYSVCQYDDGVSERAWTLSAVANEECLWLERYGAVGDVTLVTSVSVTFGSPADPWPPSPNGTPAKVYLWDDPNDDGDPIDAVLLRTTNVVVANGDTDIFVTGALSPSVVVNGAYFIGASIVTTTANDVNMSIDHSVASLGRSWTFGNPGALADSTTLSNNSFSLEMDQLDPGVWMLRSSCGPPIVNFCNPGSGGVIPCPCANPPSGGNRGCNNFGQFTGGANLTGTGNPSLSADTLSLAASGENNTSTTVFWGGASLTPPAGVIHAAGVRCVLNAGLKRLYTGTASAGAITRPGMGGPTVHIAHGGISAGQTRYYFTIYRDPQAATPAHCNQVSSTVNLSNAIAVTWVP